MMEAEEVAAAVVAVIHLLKKGKEKIKESCSAGVAPSSRDTMFTKRAFN